MMVKIGSGYLDFNDRIEVERQVKLFEEISKTNGDYSYQFTAPRTSNNIELLGKPFPDNINKPVYQKIAAQLISDSGLQIYDGFLRIEGIPDDINLSFFSGNNNWFGLLSGPLTDVGFTDLDVDQTFSNLLVYAAAEQGIVFPVVDTGALISRGYRHMKLEDFVAGIYVKTVFKRIFQHHSIKIEGDLFNDTAFNSIITIRNGKSQEQLDANDCFVEKSTTTARPGENVQYKMTFQNDSTYPYYDGANNNWDLANSKYVAPVKMKIKIEVNFVPSVVDADYNNRIYLYINGAYTFVDIGLNAGGLYNSATAGDISPFVLVRTIDLEANDELEIYAEWQQSVGSTQNDVLSGNVRITPIYIYKAFGNSVVPNWTQAEYVMNITRIFNVLTSYNAATATLTFNLFDKIKSKESLDLSEYISRTEIDYTGFISGYGKRNLLSYKQVEFEDARDYNIQNFFRYGQGSIDADNDFLSDSESILESAFSHPQSYINPVFNMSMERMNLIQTETSDSIECTGVTAGGTWAQFGISEDIFLDGDIVRVTESTNPTYNGDWIVETQASGYIELYGLLFDTNATATLTKLTLKYNESDDVYLLWHIPFYEVTKFSGYSTIRWENSNRTEVSLSYFNLLQTGRTINDDFKQSLSFGEITDPLFYQRTIIETYWQMFSRMVNDPVKLLCAANIPYNVYLTIDFMRPITIRTLETMNQYYLNRISGYESSEDECVCELIKLP